MLSRQELSELVPFRPGIGGSWLTSTVPPAGGDINAAAISHREMEFHAANPFRRHTGWFTRVVRGYQFRLLPHSADLHAQPRSHVSQDLLDIPIWESIAWPADLNSPRNCDSVSMRSSVRILRKIEGISSFVAIFLRMSISKISRVS